MASKFFLVAQREYLTRVRKRAFVVLTLLVPLVIAVFFAVVAKIAKADSTADVVDVRDESGLGVARLLTEGSTAKLQFLPVAGSLAEAKKQFQAEKHAGLLYLPAGIDPKEPKGVQFFGKGNISLDKEVRVRSAVSDAFAQLKMKQVGLTQEQLDGLRKQVDVSALSLDEAGNEKSSNSLIVTTVAGGLAVAIYIFIFLYGMQVMRGIGEEKSSRVMEVMLSSVKPFDLMMGKVLGIAAVGLTQFLLWGLLSWGATTVVAPLVLGSGSARTEVAATPARSAATTDPTDAKSALNAATSSAAESTNPANRLDMMNKAMDTLKKLDMPIWTIVFGFLAYFLGGYLLYGALFGAIGAAVDDQTDTQQFMFPITMPLLLSYILGFSVILRNPDGPVAFWMSMIPFTSPVSMVIRLPFGVPAWQLALSLALLVVGFIGTVWVAARIYRVGILMYGKKVSYKELSKWIFYKG